MVTLATVPAIVGSHLLTRLEAAGIPAGTADPASRSSAAFPTLDTPLVSIWIEDGSRLQEARAILEQVLRDLGLSGLPAADNLHQANENGAGRAIFDTSEGFGQDSGNLHGDHGGESTAGDAD